MSQKIDKLKRIAKALSPDKVDFSSIDAELDALKKKLTESVNIQTVDDVSRKLAQFQKKIDFEPLIRAFEEFKANLAEGDKKILTDLQVRLGVLNESIKGVSIKDAEGQAKMLDEISSLKELIKEISDRKPTDYTPQIEESEKKLKSLISTLSSEVKDKRDIEKIEKEIEELKKALERVRENRLGGASHIQVSTNSSVATTRYADINFVSNTAIRWTATNDDTNRRTNLTASLISGGAGGGTPGGSDTQIQFNDGGDFGGASVFTWNKNTSIVTLAGNLQLNGGTSGFVRLQASSVAGDWQMTLPANDGSANQVLTTDGNGVSRWASVAATGGSGITRTTSIITANTTGADSASTDYVYFVEATGISFTLPTAVANTNLYTIKNNSSSSVLVVSSEGIDDSPSALMPSNYESLSFLSNQSVWGVV